MDEQVIADQLKQNVAQPTVEEVTPAPPTVGEPNQAQAAAAIDLDELTQFKLHDFFGEPYRATDEVKRQQLSYIYQNVSEMVGSTDYGIVVTKMRDLEQVVGLAHTQDKMYKMYQWLKLNNVRKSIDMQMGAL